MDSPSKPPKVVKPLVYCTPPKTLENKATHTKSAPATIIKRQKANEADDPEQDDYETPSKSQTVKRRNPPDTPGFDDLRLQFCAGPVVGYPTSPTLNVKRPRLSQVDVNQTDSSAEEESDDEDRGILLKSEEYLQLMKSIDELRDANKKLEARVNHLESRLQIHDN
ncbi:hypothetical protein TRICI_000344 [Trichomonascus ciferrii]|uniref:Uncharacterized protein n=1 Tax=Trichomonascus ciferrii TaxID=44093 RepID=A0A642VDL8_9ASCO|nr:hypothetical protein TRICI_000344 [Trichomonascus ciferrii]